MLEPQKGHGLPPSYQASATLARGRKCGGTLKIERMPARTSRVGEDRVAPGMRVPVTGAASGRRSSRRAVPHRPRRGCHGPRASGPLAGRGGIRGHSLLLMGKEMTSVHAAYCSPLGAPIEPMAWAFRGARQKALVWSWVLRSRRSRAVGADVPAARRSAGEGSVDASGQGRVIGWVLRCGEDATVGRALTVQPFVVPAVVRQHGAA